MTGVRFTAGTDVGVDLSHHDQYSLPLSRESSGRNVIGLKGHPARGRGGPRDSG